MFPEHSRVSVWIHVGWDDFTPKHAPLEESTSSLGCGAEVSLASGSLCPLPTFGAPPLLCATGQVTSWGLSFLTDKV